MKKISRILLAVSAPVFALATMTVTAPTASATAAACAFNPAHPNKDSGSGHVVSGKKAPLRSGPHSGCGTIMTVDSSWKLYYHCSYFNGQSAWTHLRLAGTDVEGWIYVENLNDFGADKTC
ncbi:SH3 domain-containing protein [Streptomyces sp. NPDC058297]|uniref:SH3 domain-containing protein n=1 Tax=Streptomyces sp. NPDC058297 TaxID=3346433 RepID=UPI0036E1773C